MIKNKIKKLHIIITWYLYFKWDEDKPFWLTLQDLFDAENL
jgi:hypothetical protein